jgi:CheY-like chemotaxis protein
MSNPVTTSSPFILVVEDIASVRELMQVQLELQGYRVATVRDGQEALDFLDKERPAAIITDILMPRVDGFALAHRLRTNPETANIPIIFLSATYVSADDERFALDLGAMQFLAKPISTSDLFRALSDALSKPAATDFTMAEREFYMRYRHRLTTKLGQKDQQIARIQRQLNALSEDQRVTYRQQLVEAEGHRAEIQNELDSLMSVLSNLE